MQSKSVALILAGLMCAAAIAAVAGIPPNRFPPIGLQTAVPDQFGEWRSVDGKMQVVDPRGPRGIEDIYNELLTRIYDNGKGDRIMLSLAWGDDQRGERQVHRPDVCYPAQGLEVQTVSDGTLPTSFGSIDVRRLTTTRGARHEPVTYWVAMAGEVVRNDYDRRMVQLRLLRSGHIPDGLLFRVSSIDADAAHAFEVQQQFVGDLLRALSPGVRERMSGLKPAGAT